MKKDSENRLFLEVDDAVKAGMKANTIYQAAARGSKTIPVVKDWENAKYSLIDYDKLHPRYQEMIIKKWGNPYDYIAREPIKQMIKFDEKAEQFYYDHRYAENKQLPLSAIHDYSWAASYLNLLLEVDKDKKTLKDRLKLTLDEFYIHVGALIKANDIKLPSSYRAIRSKMAEYAQEGYIALISKKWGNSNSAKVVDKCKDALIELISHPLQYDDVFIKMQYNKFAKSNNYKEISAETVAFYRKEYAAEIEMARKGNASMKGKYLKQSKGFRPTQPLYLVESDDNHLDYYFTELSFEGNKKNDYRKYKAIVVTDSFNDYVLGYAYSINLTSEVVKAAYVSAMHYLKMITGSWVLPHETKTDRWALKELTPFYESMGNYFPTPVGSKNRGYIENFFGNSHWKRCQKAGVNNFSGNNITAKHRGVNMEWLEQQKANRPLIGDEAYDQIDQFFHRLRYMETEKGISKHEEWMNAWNKMPDSEKRIISDAQYLYKFGIEHNYRGKGIEITNRGIEPTINGVDYSYDLDEYDISLIGKKVSVFYDPFDMSRVLITDHDRVRMMAHEAILNPRALRDHSEDTRKYLNSIHNENKDIVEQISQRTEARRQRLAENNISPEDILLNLSMSKELKQAAEVQYIAQNTQKEENTKNHDTEEAYEGFDWSKL
jgi:hypothetical protein